MNEGPVLKSTAAAPPIEPTGHENSLLDHFGLPFYFRHTPPQFMRRGIFWLTFAGILLTVFFNVLVMPHDRGSIMYSLRMAILGRGGGYMTYVQGAESMFHQFWVVAIIISGVISPLLATFSLSNERISGTMEFLRLAPLSSTSIILGKMFASGWVLHVISSVLLFIGFIFGFFGDVSPALMLKALLSIVLGCATLHAVGACMASLTIALRGFAAVIGTLMVGGWMSIFPMAGWEEKGTSFFAFLSPWGAMDGYFWHDFVGRYRYSNYAAVFFDSAAMVNFYVLAFHALVFSLLVRAASRKLENSDNTGLTPLGWILCWGFVLFTAIGIAANSNSYEQYRMTFYQNFATAALIVMFGGFGVVILAMLDHPHDRNRVLTQECERAAGREESPSRFARISHALFVAALAAVNGGMMLYLLYEANVMKNAHAGTLIAVIAGVVAESYFISIMLETAFVAYENTWARITASLIGAAVLIACLLVPVIHMEVRYSDWNSSMYQLAWEFQNKNSSGKQVRIYKTNSDSQVYIEGITNLEELQERRKQFENAPLKLFWHYHAGACVTYPILDGLVVLGLLFWRRRTYAQLVAEAQAAIGKASQREEKPEPVTVAA